MTPQTATLGELCRRLGLSRSQLTRALKRQGAPQPKGKKYPVAEVVEWIGKTIGTAGVTDELKRARTVEVKLRCARMRLDIDERKKVLMPAYIADQFIQRLTLGLKMKLYDTLENQAPVLVHGLDDIVQIRRKLRNCADEILSHCHDAVPEWRKEVEHAYKQDRPEEYAEEYEVPDDD